jgi:hypothetical protein
MYRNRGWPLNFGNVFTAEELCDGRLGYNILLIRTRIIYHIFLQLRTPCNELSLHFECLHKYSQCLKYRRAYGNENKFFHCINLLQPTGHVMHQQFNIQQLYALPTLYLCVLYLRTNSDLCHLQHKLIDFYNRDEKCLQRGTDWVFK